ncbi:MAG: hypothetical protein EAZ57_07745 [Cytophagales bacterium]|nr:MAG: hypothetical protein EAZ67_08830 [Cytophagales bacterium]TAF60430.1 MAG: hypothetical protein EAZ57_07745 [Cytophagales bacterium]
MKHLIWIFWTTTLLLFYTVSSQAQSMFMQIESNVQQGRLYEAKILADQMMRLFLSDSTRRHAELWYLYGQVSEAIYKTEDQNFKQLQNDPLGHTIYAYRQAVAIYDTLDGGIIGKNALTRLKALYTNAVNKGVEQHKAGRSEMAIPFFWDAHRIQPLDTLPLRYALSASLASDKKPKLKDICFELLRLGYNKAFVFQYLIEQNNSPQEAESILHEAYSLYPENLAFRHFETNLRDKLGSSLTTIKKLEELHRKDSLNTLYINNLITLNQKLFRWRETEKYYKKIYALDSSRYDVVYQIGTYYYNEGLKAAYSKGINVYQREGNKKATVYFKKALPYLLEAQKFKNTDKIISAITTAQNDIEKSKMPKKKKNIIVPPMDKPIIMGLDSPLVWTYDDNIEVKGIVLDEDGIFEVEINGVLASLQSADAFVARVPLKEGENTITIHAVDIEGLTSEHSFKVFRQNRQQLSLKNHLLVIAIDQYQYLDSLKNAVSTSQKLAETIANELDYFDPSRVKMLVNAEATEERIQQEITSYASNLGANDNLFIYIAGKGLYDHVQNESYFYAYNSKIDQENNLSIAKINELLADCNAKHVLILADAFFSDNKLLEQSGRSYFCQPNNFKSRYALYSSPVFSPSKTTASYQSLYLKDSTFTNSLHKPILAEEYPLADYMVSFIKSQKSPFSVFDIYLGAVLLPFSDRSFHLNRFATKDEGGEWTFYKKSN